jgi:hypothetical protein
MQTMTVTRSIACKLVNLCLRINEVQLLAEIFMGQIIEPRPDDTEDAAAGRSAVADFLSALATALRS